MFLANIKDLEERTLNMNEQNPKSEKLVGERAMACDKQSHNVSTQTC